MTVHRCASLVLAPLAALAASQLLAASAPAATAKRPAACVDTTLRPNADNLVQVRASTLCLINRNRYRHHLRALKADTSLTNTAQAYSEQMVHDTFFDHTSPTGTTLLDRVEHTTRYLLGAVSYGLGENIAWGSGHYATPIETVNSWMHSPGHRRNILDRGFQNIGIGVAVGAPDGTGEAATYTTDFGRRTRSRKARHR